MKIEIRIEPGCSDEVKNVVEKIKFTFVVPIIGVKWWQFWKRSKLDVENVVMKISDHDDSKSCVHMNEKTGQIWFPNTVNV